MKLRTRIGGVVGTGLICLSAAALAQQPATADRAQPPVATFKSSVDLVRVSAVVRNRKGRFMTDMSVRDFEVLDAGVVRRISEFRHDDSGVSVALLFDISGSMESRMPNAREAKLDFCRGTSYAGEVGAHPRDPALRSPGNTA